MSNIPHDPAAAAADLRARALAVTPEQFGVPPVEPGGAYGVLMEMGLPNAVVTLVAFLTGDASLYFSTGGGVLGGVGHEAVRQAARQLVTLADPLASGLPVTTECPLPGPGRTRFYVLTTTGIRTAEAPERDLAERRHPLAPLFFAGHQVIAELRRVTGDR